MKAITILQPWASLIACGAKQIETRSWATKYRGKIAIHAGRGIADIPDYLEEAIEGALFYCHEERFIEELPRGQVIAIANLVDCQLMTKELIQEKKRTVQGLNELAFGYWEPGRFAWILDNIRPIEPVPAKGMQRLWEWDKYRGGAD